MIRGTTLLGMENHARFDPVTVGAVLPYGEKILFR